MRRQGGIVAATGSRRRGREAAEAALAACGEICGRKLQPECGHRCTQLCHAGACPPCPQTVASRCHCGRSLQQRRCADRLWSCGCPCARPLACGAHACPSPCHTGPCAACAVAVARRCACGRHEASVACGTGEWHCDEPCGRPLACGQHVCERVCHAGECGGCPRAGARTCHCGKEVFRGLACTRPTPSCGRLCEKLLPCGLHRCHDICHKGPCADCSEVVVKTCRCGAARKTMVCSAEFLCDRRCSKLRNCGKHQCRKRCCAGDCPPCTDICGAALNCNNHICEAQCHPGPCFPCPITVEKTCACKGTRIVVPCGAAKQTPAPACPLPCRLPSPCHHPVVPHKCHYGRCPHCRQVCGLIHPECGHACPSTCHDVLPPCLAAKAADPTDPEQTKCPPCSILVERQCAGKHVVKKFQCSGAPDVFQCKSQCGQLLACGRHNRPCVAPRSCPHACAIPCHAGPCGPCEAAVKLRCHCGSVEKSIKCWQTTALPEAELSAMLCCRQKCRKSLPNCTHDCQAICHPGACPGPDECTRKVAITCTCGRTKETWLCSRAQKERQRTGVTSKSFNALLPCTPECATAAAAAAAGRVQTSAREGAKKPSQQHQKKGVVESAPKWRPHKKSVWPRRVLMAGAFVAAVAAILVLAQ
eukprot:m51a1_g983 putative C-tail anchored protein (646) ;mRNA; f:442076-444932